VTLEFKLKGFQGYVVKTATVLSDDPANPRVTLLVEGTVKPLIDVQPERTIYFQGVADSLTEKTVDLVTTSKQFHILKTDDELDKKAVYKLETVENGKHYRLRVSNNTLRGDYGGYITLYTDFAEKPVLTVWVNGSIEGEIGIRPKVLIVGRLSTNQGVSSGKVLVINNKSRAFKIVRCEYDERILHVTRMPFSNGPGFSLEVIPNMENIPPGGRIQTVLKVETDVPSEGEQEVQVLVIDLEEHK
jgi:hypothetical protein